MPRPRSKKTAAVIERPAPPVCATCQHELDWRDQMYGGKARAATNDTPASGPTCKRCHQLAARRALRGSVVTMATKVVVQGPRGHKRLVPMKGRPIVRRQRMRSVHGGSYAAQRIAAYGASAFAKRLRRAAMVAR